MNKKVIIKSVGSNTVVTVAPTGSSWGSIIASNNSDIIGMIMIIIIRIDGNIIIVINSINQTSTRLGKDNNISNLGTGTGADIGLVLGTEIGIHPGGN